MWNRLASGTCNNESPHSPDVMKIVITVNKNDVWFCKICVASIRFYYPDVPILLLKDELNGRFSTVEIERYWKVQLITFPITKFGWSAAKMHLYTDPRFAGQKFLVLDADIIMVGARNAGS